MSSFRQSCCIPMSTDRTQGDLEMLLEGTAKIGYAAVEIWGRWGMDPDYRTFLKMAADNGLAISGMAGTGFSLNNPADHPRLKE